MVRVVIVLILLRCAAACSPLDVPQGAVELSGQRCAFWTREAVGGDATALSDCYSPAYNDILMKVGDVAVGAVHQRLFSVTTTLDFYACDTKEVVVSEDVLSGLSPVRSLHASYTARTPAGDVLATITRDVERKIIFRAPNGAVLGNVSTTLGSLVEGTMCIGTEWNVVCLSTSPLTRRMVFYFASWYALHRRSAPTCHTVYYLIVAGIPCLCIVLFVGGVLAIYRKKCRN